MLVSIRAEEPTTARYEIRIKGRLSDVTIAGLEGFTAEPKPVETVLHGETLDQAALHGILDRIQQLGLELVEVRRLPEPPPSRAGKPA